ncbi:MAG: hypothetical protein FK734_14970 [Asgard group archaeon]|nr:hypothetical protein [Asgard group archaeon]
MPYCPRCGVEVESNKTHCPLCNTLLQQIDEEKPKYTTKYPNDIPKEDIKQPRARRKRRFLALEITSVVLVIPLVVTLTTNVLVDGVVSWSLYPVASLLLAWCLISAPLIFHKKYLAIAAGEFIPLLIYFLILDLIDNGAINWYVRVALPIVGTVGIATFLVVFGAIKVKNRGFNVVAFALFGASIICLITDVSITSYIQSSPGLNWSLYVIIPTILIGGFLLYIHYRLMKNKDLKRKLQP